MAFDRDCTLYYPTVTSYSGTSYEVSGALHSWLERRHYLAACPCRRRRRGNTHLDGWLQGVWNAMNDMTKRTPDFSYDMITFEEMLVFHNVPMNCT